MLKRPRTFTELRQGSYVSQRALEGLLREVATHGVLDVASRRSMRRETDALTSRVTPIWAVASDVYVAVWRRPARGRRCATSPRDAPRRAARVQWIGHTDAEVDRCCTSDGT